MAIFNSKLLVLPEGTPFFSAINHLQYDQTWPLATRCDSDRRSWHQSLLGALIPQRLVDGEPFGERKSSTNVG